MGKIVGADNLIEWLKLMTLLGIFGFRCAKAAQLNLPVGITINFTATHRGHDLERFKQWQNPEGAVIAAWHSQSWFLNFFTVQASNQQITSLSFCKMVPKTTI